MKNRCLLCALNALLLASKLSTVVSLALLPKLFRMQIVECRFHAMLTNKRQRTESRINQSLKLINLGIDLCEKLVVENSDGMQLAEHNSNGLLMSDRFSELCFQLVGIRACRRTARHDDMQR